MVSSNARDKVLDKISLPARRKAPSPKLADSKGGNFQWEDLQYVVEGLMFAQRPVRAAMEAVTSRYKLAPRGAFILSMLQEGMTFPADLAVALRVSKSMITKELALLTEAGLVAVVNDKTDKRRSALSLTTQGECVCGEVRESMIKVLSRNLDAYTEDQIRLLGDMLRDARQLADEERELWEA